MVLLVGAALFIGSFATLMRIDPGFNPDRVLMAQVFPRFEPGKPQVDSSAQFARVIERLSGVPGVLHASAITGGAPLFGGSTGTSITLPDRPDVKNQMVSYRRVTPAYYQAMGIPLRKGRVFEATDPGRPASPSSTSRSSGGSLPMATRWAAPLRSAPAAGDHHHRRRRRYSSTSLEAPPREGCICRSQVEMPAAIVIRTSGDPTPSYRRSKPPYEAFPDVPPERSTMEVATRTAQRRLNMLLIRLPAARVVISGVGIYGESAMRCHRTRDRIRIALGASRSSVMRSASNAGDHGRFGGRDWQRRLWYLTDCEAFCFSSVRKSPARFAAALLVLGAAALS